MNKVEKVKEYFLGGVVFIGAIALPVLFLKGGVWMFEVLYPFLDKLSSIGWIAIIALLLVSIFPKARGFAGTGIVLASYLWGAILWLTSLFVTYSLWGWLGTIIGVCFFGFGVFATSLLALIFKGDISAAFSFLVSLLLIYGFRILGTRMAEKHEQRVFEENNRNVVYEIEEEHNPN